MLVDWLPWSHTFGGNHNLNLVLAFGGTLYIDDGKPAPALFARTVRNLRESPPPSTTTSPPATRSSLPRLEADAALRRAFFARLRLMFYAAAALPQALGPPRAVADERGP